MSHCVSTIICTHNPRADYLARVLEALRAQTLRLDQWELLVVDNASQEKLASLWDLSWHPNGRHLREDHLGLTSARLRGITEAKGETLVFVDDDNVLAPNYLQEALQIARDWPLLGAWGGTIKGEFEVEPEPWTQPLLANLGIREFSKPLWSNNPEDWRSQPCGAGMCIRKAVAKSYATQVERQEARRHLDRVGASLSSCGDSDLAQTSCELGKGFGNFPQLVLTHLIPESRVRPDYLIRLMQGITASWIVLRYLRFGVLPPQPKALKVTARYLMTRVTEGKQSAQLYKAQQNATLMGIRAACSLREDATRKAG